jgi:hypothetical protein
MVVPWIGRIFTTVARSEGVVLLLNCWWTSSPTRIRRRPGKAGVGHGWECTNKQLQTLRWGLRHESLCTEKNEKRRAEVPAAKTEIFRQDKQIQLNLQRF